MHAKLITLIATAALPICLFAQEATVESAAPASTRSRAEVQAELEHAKNNGGMKHLRPDYVGEVTQPRSRAEIRSELERARMDGQLAAISAEAHGFSKVSPKGIYAAAR